MTKLTKEQIKFFIETMTDDMHNTTQHEIAETLLSKFDECESLQAKLLAYEQASKNPVAWIVHMRTGDQFTTDSDFVGLGESTHGIHSTPLYAAPVLPKQPESESIICWSCKKTITLTQHAEADGFCPLCDAEIELEPTQPVIPEQPDSQDLELYIDMLENSDSDDEDGELNNTQLIMWLKELQRRRTLPAQPVSEPYKLPDGWVMVPQQIFLDASDIESICSQCGDGHKSWYGDFTDGLLWVGDIQCDNGTIMHGLHISSSDYQEEGGLTLAEFKAPAQEGE
ncbi:hypothetical protein [Hafnia alvei]|uniref:hypothetical protein n=1 Tax=Hafnia alvei TaxID=569 RepID=UPI001D110025|nr:hypothetical protein [Hafnia alvei]